MYLEHFKFKELPFTITPNVGFFCSLKGHQEALNTLLFALRSGEGFIKIIGEVGSGKTLLCRKLLSSLEGEFVTAYIPNPDLNPIELRRALGREIGVDLSLLQDQHELLTQINQRLLSLYAQGKRIVLLIDEAQAIPPESLETLRLLTNLETETTKLLQVVLFGQPELDDNLNLQHFRQLKQRITFSYYLPLMTREDLDSYLFHRLATAGYSHAALFTNKARNILYDYSGGVPRIVNILCHKALLVAYGKGDEKISHKTMWHAIKDTDVAHAKSHKMLSLTIFTLGILIIVLLSVYLYKGII
ncbi:MAG: AAA family ATPase [Gammaproteobacteria bacterium]|nr:AAA family ATPase [Gammaproteobacteria bacterium]